MDVISFIVIYKTKKYGDTHTHSRTYAYRWNEMSSNDFRTLNIALGIWTIGMNHLSTSYTFI